MGVTKRPVNVTPKGGALAWITCAPPPLERSIEIEFPCLILWRDAIRFTLSSYSGARRCHLETRVFHPTGEVPRRLCGLQQGKLHRAGYSFVLDADIKGFFDNRSHQIILQKVAERVADGNMLPLVEKFLTSGVMDNGVF